MDWGTWTSPISSKLLTSDTAVSFADMQLDPTESGRGVIYWSEFRVAEGGRGVICSCGPDQKVFSWTPPEFSVRTSVHEYGGGSFLVYDGVVYFSNKDSRLYKQDDPAVVPVPISPDSKAFKYADGIFFKNGIYCIREDHTNATNGKEPINTLIRLDVASQKQTVLVEGMDFYASPQISPKGEKFAWMQWKHPNMPWDTCEVAVAKLTPDGLLDASSIRKVAATRGVSNILPRFSIDGNLFFMSDRSDWYNLYSTDESGDQKNVCPKEKDAAGPMWVLGHHAYAFDSSPSGDVAVAFAKELGILNLKSGIYYKLETGFISHSYLLYGSNKCIYCVASSPTRFPAIIQHNVQTGKTDILRVSKTCTAEECFLSVPEHISFPTGTDLDSLAYGYYYQPKNKNFKGPSDRLPPLLVNVHGGPTASACDDLDLTRQYYTSRGFAVLDVNYRGSVGYGKKYRQLLNENYGIYDVEDVCNGALHLVKERKVDAHKLIIKGRSSGGYTVLAALTFKNLFKAGISYFGISDLEELAKDTHKFEKHYFDSLIGPYPAMKEAYVERSPINFVDKISAPVCFFQGLDDKVVPPDQARKMHDALLAKGVPTSLVLFEGEGHGFKKADSIELALDGEYIFICKILGITPSVQLPDNSKFVISNL